MFCEGPQAPERRVMVQRGRKADRSVGEPVTNDREPANKSKAAKRFGRQSQRTKAINLAPAPMRGGIRL